jgi:hypothetical protein
MTPAGSAHRVGEERALLLVDYVLIGKQSNPRPNLQFPQNWAEGLTTHFL